MPYRAHQQGIMQTVNQLVPTCQGMRTGSLSFASIRPRRLKGQVCALQCTPTPPPPPPQPTPTPTCQIKFVSMDRRCISAGVRVSTCKCTRRRERQQKDGRRKKEEGRRMEKKVSSNAPWLRHMAIELKSRNRLPSWFQK